MKLTRLRFDTIVCPLDRSSRRKFVLVLPCLGTICTLLIYLTSTIKSGYHRPMVVFGAVSRDTFGRSADMLMAVQSYISDITSHENRNWYIGLLLSVSYFGNTLGYIIIGNIFKVSYITDVSGTIINLHAACLLWSLAFIKTVRNLQKVHPQKR